MKTLSPHEVMVLKDLLTTMDSTAKHQALLAIINHLGDSYILRPVRLREIFDWSRKYSDLSKTR